MIYLILGALYVGWLCWLCWRSKRDNGYIVKPGESRLTFAAWAAGFVLLWSLVAALHGYVAIRDR